MLKFGKDNKIDNLDVSLVEEEPQKETALSFFRDKVFKSKTAKAVFMGAILLKSSIPSFGANNDAKTIDKYILKTSVNSIKESKVDTEDTKTFKTKIEDYKKFQEQIILKAGSNFDSGKSTLKNIENIKSNFNNFLSKIDKDNFSNIINKDWIVKGSSDEVMNLNIGGNKQLTEDRVNALNVLLRESLINYDFSKQLSPEQIKIIMEKDIVGSYPDSSSEKGVTYITDLVNPLTGLNYTESEAKSIKENNPEEYRKLLASCRYTNFELKINNQKMFNLDNYTHGVVLFDKSGSMKITTEDMVNGLDKAISSNKDKPFYLLTYSNNIDKGSLKIIKPGESEKILHSINFNGSGNEKSISSTIEYIKSIKPDFSREGLRRIIYVVTDEGIQDPENLLELENLADKTNTDIEFVMFTPGGSNFIKVDLETLKNKILDDNNKTIADINTFKDIDGNDVKFKTY